jgi:serine/threonine-protein kinase
MPGGKADELIESVRALFGRELEIERELGRGGMAVVFLAHDPALQRRVAVKVLLPEHAQDEMTAARFLREARTVAALQHPHVVSVYGVRSDSELSAIVMQFVDGRSLDVLLAEEPRLSTAVAGLLLAQAAAGLQHAHDRGIIHRDVKPANVLVDREGRAVVSDFGIALREGTTRLTDTGMVIGTMAYMSPEQRAGGAVGPAADQYALGVMAFELLAGRLPFTGTMPEMLAQHMKDSPPPLGELRPDLASFVANTVMRMLEKKPELRFKDLREPERVFRVLAPDEKATTSVLASMSTVGAAAGSRARRAVTPPPGDATPAPASTSDTSGVRRSLPPDKRAPTDRWRMAARRLKKRMRPLAFAAVTLAALVAAVWAASTDWSGSRPPGAAANAADSVATPAAGRAESVGGATNAKSSVPGRSPSSTAQARIVPGTPAAVSSATRTSAARPVESGARASSFPVSPTSTASGTPTSSAPSSAAPVPGPTLSSAAPTTSATLADARTAARQFVTMLNQHRWSELEQLEPFGGDAELRTELLQLTRSAPGFAVGFERVASLPSPTPDGFATDFIVDVEWRGGKRLATVRLRAVAQGGTWRLAAFGVSTPD